MYPLLRQKSVLLRLLCVMLLVARMDGAHWHLCFDGKEPPVSLHLLDAQTHHEEGAAMTAAHHDADVMMNGDILPKPGKMTLQLDSAPALLAAVFLLALLFTRQAHPLSADFRAIVLAPLFLLPPLRGPPR